jgi:hypothetical protein
MSIRGVKLLCATLLICAGVIAAEVGALRPHGGSGGGIAMAFGIFYFVSTWYDWGRKRGNEPGELAGSSPGDASQNHPVQPGEQRQ